MQVKTEIKIACYVEPLESVLNGALLTIKVKMK
jgi:hypothetical protein